MQRHYSRFVKHAEYDPLPGDDPSAARRELKERPNIDGLEFAGIIGHGNFSHVYDGALRGRRAAIKVIERGSDYAVSTEIEVLQTLYGLPHVSQLLAFYSSPQPLLVFDYAPAVRINSFFGSIALVELRALLRAVLDALCGAHRRGVVHRDVKLQNVLVAPGFSSVVLADWGSAAFISDSLNTKAGSRSVRPPEMLLGHRGYGAGCDVWAFGVLVLYFLTEGSIPWKARTGGASLHLMAAFFGKGPLLELAERYGKRVPAQLASAPDAPTRSLAAEFTARRENICSPELIDLMQKCLSVDPNKRLTAEAALSHPFFAPGAETAHGNGGEASSP